MKLKHLFIGALAVITIAIGPMISSGYPEGILPPSGYGITNPDVTQQNINETICKANWTATIRPTTTYTNYLKKKQIADFKYKDATPSRYEEDHLISLQLGGHPSDPKNLWPQAYDVYYKGELLGARQKDKVETVLKREVCDGTITLKDAQAAISKDWVKLYHELNNVSSAEGDTDD